MRPATTTIYGDTGLWFLSTGEILPAGRWSVSAYRVNYDREQGFTDISTWPVTFGVGVRDRAEIFGSVRLINRVDRDIRPLFTSDPGSGGFVQDVPFVHEGWTGNVFGSFYLGAKINLLSEYEQDPAAFALRGMVKIPTEDDADGGGTGKMDFLIDAIFSKDIQQRVELAANAGFAFRGAPDEVEISNSFTWGIGAGFPSRRALRLQAELRGELMFDDQLTGAPFAGMPPISFNSSTADASIGVTWQHATDSLRARGWRGRSIRAAATALAISRTWAGTVWGSRRGWAITPGCASMCRRRRPPRHRRHPRRPGPDTSCR